MHSLCTVIRFSLKEKKQVTKNYLLPIIFSDLGHANDTTQTVSYLISNLDSDADSGYCAIVHQVLGTKS